MRYVHRVVVVSFLLLLTARCVSIWAQQAQGSFTGTVTDPSGAVVPDVAVTATEKDTGFSRSAVSSRDGTYTIPLLPPGQYTVSAEKQGFETYSQGPIPLTVNQQAELNIALKVGSQTTTVQVEASAPVLDTQDSSVGTTVEQTKVSQLPFNGRHFLEATLFTPGVVPGSQGSELNDNRGGSINVNGMRETMNTFLVDGLNNTSIAVGTYSATPPLDSIQEFRMETGVYDARFGTNAGAQVNMVIKSGTNQYHGTLYEYLRNGKLDARNFFEPEVPPFHRNQFGASVGGPISLGKLYNGHDRTFFFLNYEGLRDNRSFFSRAHVPTAAEQNGNFSDLLAPDCTTKTALINPLALLAGDTNPNDLLMTQLPYVDPVGAKIAALYPAPNIANAPCGGENYTTQVLRKFNINDYVARFDHRWGMKDNLSYRYILTTDSESTPSGLPTGLPGFGTKRDDWFHVTGLDWTHAFRPTLLSEAKVGYSRWQYRWNNQDQGQLVGQQLGIKGIATAYRDTGVPNFGISGFDGLGAGTNLPQAGAVNTFQFADTISQVRGAHSLAYGVDIKTIKRGNFFIDTNARSVFGFTGIVSGCPAINAQLAAACAQLQALFTQQLGGNVAFGNGLADALLGIPTDWTNGFSQYISGTATQHAFFVQDTWKVRRNLTLNLGLRYEYNSLVTDKANRFGGFDFNYSCPVAGTALTTPGAVLSAGPTVGIDCFEGVVNGVAGPLGQFVQVGTLTLGSTSRNRALQRPDRNNIGPRVGFAWQPFDSIKTVIRGGAGVYYDQMTGELYFQKSANPPHVQINVGDLIDTPQVLGQIIQACAPPTPQCPLGTGFVIQNALTTAVAPLFPVLSPVVINLEDSTVYQWSFDVQRELPSSWLLDVGYVGTRGLHLPFMWDPNMAIPDPVTKTNPRPFPNYLGMSYTDSVGKSIYHSLQVKGERHYANGLAVIAAYTYGKALDTNSTYFSTNGSANFPQNSFNRAAEKGRSDFDYRHRLSLAYVYDLPFGNKILRSGNSAANYVIQGWQLAGIVMKQSGPPYTPTWGPNISHNGDGNDRPNVVPGVPFYPARQTVKQWANPLAFNRDPSTEYQFGNAGRDILTGPGGGVWDFSLIRKFKLTESKTLEFRAEMFNIFNSPNFALPNGDAHCSCFGVIGNTVQPIAGQASGGPGEPREIQFALRFTW